MRSVDSSLIRERARRLRRDTTDAERNLWHYLRGHQFGGLKFRRQHPIGPFIADFCCPDSFVVIELDGGQHASKQPADARRTEYLETRGYRVLRFWDHDVLNNIEGVLERIEDFLSEPHPHPLHEGVEREQKVGE